MQIHRRSFLTSLGVSLIAAPAIVRATSIMPVRTLRFTEYYSNRVIRTYMDATAIRDRNIFLRLEEFTPPLLNCFGIPVRTVICVGGLPDVA